MCASQCGISSLRGYSVVQGMPTTLKHIAIGLTTAALAITLGRVSATAWPRGDSGFDGGTASGADMIVGGVDGVSAFGAVSSDGETIMAYSLGSTECNVGTVVLAEDAVSNQHLVIAQNLYRISGGAIEQVGMSWVKHNYCALQGTACGTCQPVGGGCPSALGIGCSSPNASGASGTQTNMGPRSQVNASTGHFDFPVVGVPAAPPTIGRRLQVNSDDLAPAMNAGATYIAECVYVHPQDALAGNNGNNASYRNVNVGTVLVGSTYPLTLMGQTVQQKCAIYAWQQAQPAVDVQEVRTPDGGVVVGSLVTDNGNGTWHYEYAIMNVSSDASIGGVSVPVHAGTVVTNQSFRDVHYHSGEPYSGADWAMESSGGQVLWSTEPFAQNANANALRWGTLYNFRFDAAAPPVPGTMTLELFKVQGSVGVVVPVPASAGRPADLNADGQVDGADLGMLLSMWGSCAGCAADLDSSGAVDGADLGTLLGDWGI